MVTGVLACVLASFAGWGEAAVLAVLCGLVLVVALLSVMGSSPHALTIRLPQDRTVAGRTVVGELAARNRRNGRSRTGVIELPVGAGAAQFVVPPLAGKAEWSEVFAVATRRREVIVVGPARSVRADALGLLRRTRVWTRPNLLHVHPRTVRVPFDATGFQADVEGVTTAKLSSSDVSFHALRDYVPGDDRRHVHWATSARTGRLVVRQYEETRRSHHVILLDTVRSHWSGEDFEVGVSVAASLALPGLSASRRVSMATSQGWISTATPVRMLDELTELGRSPEETDPAQRLREVLAARPGASVVTVVVGPVTTDVQAAHLATLAGVDVACGIVRAGSGHTPRRRRVGSGTLLDCPELEDLPRLLNRGVGR